MMRFPAARSTSRAPSSTTSLGILATAWRRSAALLMAAAVAVCARGTGRRPDRGARRIHGARHERRGPGRASRRACPQRGPFTFPAPYKTVGARLTNAGDCGGNDCVNYVGYSYWRNSNNHVGSDTMLIVITLDRARGGAGPTLFSYDKRTDQVTVVGPLFDQASPLSWATGEGWYWSATLPTKLYVNQGPRLSRYDVLPGQLETVFDVAAQFGPDRYIWQMHSSSDDRVHSATLRSSVTYEMLGCIVYREDTRTFRSFPKIGDFDECQVDKSGRWLADQGERRRRLRRGQSDRRPRGGHRDAVPRPGGSRRPLRHRPRLHGRRRTTGTRCPAPSACGRSASRCPACRPRARSCTGRRTGRSTSDTSPTPTRGPACRSISNSRAEARRRRSSLPRANEIVCFRLDASLAGAGGGAHDDRPQRGGRGQSDYAKLPKGNLDVTGQYFIWTSNAGEQSAGRLRRQGAVAAPGVGAAAAAPPAGTAPVVSISAPAAGDTVSAAVVVSASASDSSGIAGVQFKVDGVNLGPRSRHRPSP